MKNNTSKFKEFLVKHGIKKLRNYGERVTNIKKNKKKANK